MRQIGGIFSFYEIVTTLMRQSKDKNRKDGDEREREREMFWDGKRIHKK